jgi:hypothetical protein
VGDQKDPKDWWDKLSAITPLILGLAVTGVGAVFTNIYNNRQLELNKIEALDKLRPLLTSGKPEDREFAYASFRALGYEQVAIRIIQVNKDQSGRSVLIQIAKSASSEVKSEADSTLKTLDQARKLVNVAEFGTAQPDPKFLQAHPDLAAHLDADEVWAKSAAGELGMSSPLAIAILEDTSAQMGRHQAEALIQATLAAIPGSRNTRQQQSTWLLEFLNQRDRYVQARPAFAKFATALLNRTNRLRDLVKNGDWELKSLGQNGTAK